MAVSREFIVEKLNELVPSLNTSVGSRADVVLIQPLVSLFEGFNEQEFTEFLTTRIEEYDSNIVVSRGTANYDILVAALTAVLEPLWWEIKTVKEWQSLTNFGSMPDEEMDALVANYFMVRSQGSKSRGTVKIYFSRPETIIFNEFIRFVTRSGLGFIPEEPSIIQADAMSLNQEGGLYYTEIVVEAELEGKDYDILSNQIISVENLPVNFVRVVNTSAFTGGTDKETNTELFDRARDAITVRNLQTKKGIRYNVRTEFPRVSAIEVVGFGDSEMLRDLIQYGYTTTTTITQTISGGVPVTIGTTTVTGANYVNHGAMADVHVYTEDLVEGHSDITNIDPTISIGLSRLPPYVTNMPLIRVKEIERLDPLYLTGTGQLIPGAKPIDARVLRDFYFSRDENTLERAIGTVRVFFEQPTSFEVTTNTVLTADNGQVFSPLQTQSISASGMSVNTGQKITKTAMESNIIYNQNITYYYVDISVQSVNAGDDNSLLSDGDYLSITNYTAEGWYLSAEDPNLSFSTEDQVNLTFSSTFNDGIAMTGEAIRIVYEYAPTVAEIQDYVDDDEERVVTTDTLIKHFQPAYVDIALTYEGLGLDTADAEIYVRDFINSISQGTYFEVSDLIAMLYENGATRVVTPIEVFVLTINYDREYRAIRFSDRYRTEKRTHFIARNIDIERQ
jgi:hypothetical protein